MSCRRASRLLPSAAACVSVAAAALTLPVPATAQGNSEQFSAARLRVGPLALNPTLALTNAGVDDNVFYEPNQGEPKRDFTFTLAPHTDWWLRVGRVWFSGAVHEDLVYFHRYEGERSVNQFYKGRGELPLNHVNLYAGAEYLNTRERPGFEIDARSQRYEAVVTGGANVKVLSRTTIGLAVKRQRVDYGKADVFLGSSLRFELTRAVQVLSLTVGHRLSPVTSVVVSAERERDRFAFNPLRDSNSLQVGAALALAPFAPISGRCFFGYRRFDALGQNVPAFSGMVASVDLSYSASETLKVALQAGRQVEYSFDTDNPYYLQTGAAASVTRQIHGPFDVVGRIGVHRLDYRSVLERGPLSSGRTDYVHFQGGGVGYHFGAGLRVGFEANRQTRTSGLGDRDYGGLRYGTTITYAF